MVQLSSCLSKEDIAAYTSISILAINRILRHFVLYGAIDDEPKEQCRGAQVLHDEDVNVSSPYIFLFLFEIVQERLAAYLDELQDMLTVNCGIHVSRATVWCTIQAGGFTMKKV